MGAAGVPARVSWAVELLDLHPDDRVLEVGCGPGVAVALIADRLGGGRVTAIDRSATAVERARARTAHHVAAGRVELHQTDLASFPAPPASSDKVLAVNVNLFWTTDATAECEVLARVLTPAGTVHLVYEGPGSGGRDVAPLVVATLERGGFAAEVVRSTDDALVGIAARRR